MLIKSNPHTHSVYVDGKNTLEEMVESALSLGFTALGFSEHARQIVDLPYGLSLENEIKYIEHVKALQKKYQGRIRIWLGMERDRMSVTDKSAFEYTLAANHYLISDDGECAGVDSTDIIGPWVEKHMGGDWMKAAKTYFSEYADYVVSIKPDLIAHLDLICKGNRKYGWFNEGASEYLSYAKAAMDKMITVCRVMEVNTGGIARSNQPCPYPILPMLSYWKKLGGEVIPASDCHRAHQLGAYFDECPAYLKEAGFTQMLQLGTEDKLFEIVKL